MKIVDFSEHLFIRVYDTNDSVSLSGWAYLNLNKELIEQYSKNIEFAQSLPEPLKKVSHYEADVLFISDYDGLPDSLQELIDEELPPSSNYFFVNECDIEELEIVNTDLEETFYTKTDKSVYFQASISGIDSEVIMKTFHLPFSLLEKAIK